MGGYGDHDILSLGGHVDAEGTEVVLDLETFHVPGIGEAASLGQS